MGMLGRHDFVQTFVVCPLCGRVWYKRLYSTGAVRLLVADGDKLLDHANCKQMAAKEGEKFTRELERIINGTDK